MIIFQIELSQLIYLTQTLLEDIINSTNIGIKRKNYYMINTNAQIHNASATLELEYLNTFLNICHQKGYSLTMIKF